MTLHDLMSEKELEDNAPMDEHELARFLWEVRERRNTMIVERGIMFRLFSTIAEAQNG